MWTYRSPPSPWPSLSLSPLCSPNAYSYSQSEDGWNPGQGQGQEQGQEQKKTEQEQEQEQAQGTQTTANPSEDDTSALCGRTDRMWMRRERRTRAGMRTRRMFASALEPHKEKKWMRIKGRTKYDATKAMGQYLLWRSSVEPGEIYLDHLILFLAQGRDGDISLSFPSFFPFHFFLFVCLINSSKYSLSLSLCVCVCVCVCVCHSYQ